MAYRTKIIEHMEAVSDELESKGLARLNLKGVARGAGVSYSSLLRYATETRSDVGVDLPNKVRTWLNSLLPKREQFSELGYIYEVDEEGQLAGVA